MKFLTALLVAASALFADTQNGASQIFNPYVYWGGTGADSSSKLLFLNGSIKRDSSGTYVTASDSCSKWFHTETGNAKPSDSYTLRYRFKGKSATDTVVFKIDNRVCHSTVWNKCQTTISAHHNFMLDRVPVVDTITVTKAGTTYSGELRTYFIPGSGNYQRLCPIKKNWGSTDTLWMDSLAVGGQ